MGLVGRSKSIFVVTFIFLLLSFTTVALRCYVRLRLVGRFGWDDTLMTLAMALNIWFATCGLAGSMAGIGRRLDEFDRPQAIERALLWWWLGQSAYVWVVTIARLSIATLLLRIAARRSDCVIPYVVMGLTVAVGLPFWLLLMLQCRPVQEFWQRTGDGHCINTKYVLDVAYLYSVTACLCDFTLGLYPIYLLRNLRMSRRSKWALAGILGLGCVASTAVVVRIPFLPDYMDPDFLYRSHSSQFDLDSSWPGDCQSEVELGDSQFVSTPVTSQSSSARILEEGQARPGQVHDGITVEAAVQQ
ncbi:hypothetical protein BJX96DRAFT_165319 [Aspergillus floccosus]